MAGLLDNVFASNTEDPRYAANMALFGNMVKGDFGGGLLAASTAGADAKKAQAEAQYRQMQMQNIQSEMAQRQLKIEQDHRQQELIRSVFGGAGQPGQSGQPSGAPSGAMPPPSGQPAGMPSGQPGGVMNRLTPDQLAQLKMAGVDLTDIYKLANVPTALAAGGYSQLPGQAPRYMPDPVKGVDVNPDGSVRLMPGAAQTQSQLTLATEGPKALLGAAGRTNLRTMPDGTQRPVSELDENPTLQAILQQYTNAGQPQQPPMQRPMVPQAQPGMQPQMLPRPSVPPQAGMNGAFVGSPEQVSASIDAIQDPQERANARSAFESQMRSSGGRLGQYGMSTAQTTQAAADKVKAEAQARADVERQTGKTKKVDSANDMLGNIWRARVLLESDPTGSLAGAGVDKMLGAFGKSTPSAQNADRLETLAGWLTSNTPRMEGPQSDKDVENYKIMAGRIGDRTYPAARRLAALDEVERIQKKYANPQGAQSGQPTVLAELPKQAQKGQRVRDTATNEILEFNGLSWTKAK